MRLWIKKSAASGKAVRSKLQEMSSGFFAGHFVERAKKVERDRTAIENDDKPDPTLITRYQTRKKQRTCWSPIRQKNIMPFKPIIIAENFWDGSIKMVRVPQNIPLMSCLHVFSSALLSGMRNCFGTGKRFNILGRVHDYSLGRMRPMTYFIQT